MKKALFVAQITYICAINLTKKINLNEINLYLLQ